MSGQIGAAEILKKIPGQADGAELYELYSSQRPVLFRAGALESVKAMETAGRALRVIHDGRLGFSTTTDLTAGSTLVRNALEAAQFGDRVSFQFPAQKPAQDVQCLDDEVAGLDEDGLIALGEQIVAEVKAYDPGLQIEVSLSKTVDEIHLLNTSGLDSASRRTALIAALQVTRAAEGDILILYSDASSRQRQGVDGVALAKYVIERLRWAEHIVEIEAKALPVVFNGPGTLPLFLPLMEGLNGRNVFLGTSPLGEKVGQAVFDGRFTLMDDGCLDWALRSAPCDDEGTPTSAKPLIDGGIVRQFLYDLKTAAQAGAQSTGNGFRSNAIFGGDFRRPPGVAMSSWTIHPGEHSLEQILCGLGEALLVEDVIGLGQGNTMAGEFSNNVGLGFLVRGGEVVGRVKNTMIAGNVYDLFKDHLIALGDRPEWVWGVLRAPAIALSGVGVVSGQ